MALRASLLLISLEVSLLLAPRAEAMETPAPVVESYELDVRFEPEESWMSAEATVRFGPLANQPTELTFVLHGELRVESVSVGGRALEFEQQPIFYRSDYSLVARQVVVRWPEDGSEEALTVRYEGFFSPSRVRSPSDYMRIDSSGVYLRSIGYSPWFPVFTKAGDYDGRATFTRVVLRAPAEFKTVFVGEFLGESEADGERVSVWRAADIPIFDAQCTSHRFSVLREGETFLYSRNDEPSRLAAPKIGVFARRLAGLFAEHYRPGVTSSQVHVLQMPPFGDISSGNVVGVTTERWVSFETDERSRRTLAHEIVHPFVQLPTPPGDPIRALVMEGFPSFFHLPMLAQLRGDEAGYERLMDRLMDSYLQKRSTGRSLRGEELPIEKPLATIREDEIGLYKDRFVLSDRAPLFLDYLLRTMGRDRFFRFTRSLFERSELSLAGFYQEVLAHLPEAGEDSRLWLETNEYPDRFRRPAPGRSVEEAP